MQKIIIQGELCDLNTYINTTRANKFASAKIKKEQTNYVWGCCKEQGAKPIKDYPIMISFKWFVKNKRKDPDNVCFQKKWIMDGLVLAGVIENDTMEFIEGFQDSFEVDKENPRIEITLF